MTSLGDYNEMLSVSDVFAPRQRPRRLQPLHVSSIKANIGHAEAAAGISSLIKVLLMLRNSAIPPHIGIKGMVNPAFPQDLETRNVHIPFVGKSWLPKTDTPRVAFLNNFSAAGGNTALLLREHRPQSAKREKHPRSTHIISVSAKTIRSMQMNIERLATFIQENPNTNIADLSYTLTARRLAHPYRKTFAVAQLAEARNILAFDADQSFAPMASKPPKMIFTFTGQGSLYCSFARNLFQTCTRFRHDILELDCIATAQGLPSFLELIDGPAKDATSLSPVISQVGQVCVQVALARLWISWGIQPSAVIGHSLGEYPALVIAGVLTASDMIYLVGRRAQLLLELCISRSHGMLAVNADTESLLNRISGTALEIACINAPKMTVLGGAREALKNCARELQAEGIICTWLPAVHAYHTAQVDAILTAFRHSAEHLIFAPPQLPVLSPLLSRVIEVGSNVFNAEYLCRQAREMVNFQGALFSIRNRSEWTDNAIWLEVGPHPTCTHFVQQTLGPVASVAKSLYRGHDPWKTMSESLCSLHDRGFVVDWEQYHQGFDDYHKLIDLPAYAWDLKNFWIDYRNDWALTKGDVIQAAKETSITSVPPRLATTTVQKIVEEKIESGTASLIAETDFSNSYLAHIAAGHRVNGVSLCPSSLYADMALTVAKYLYQEIHSNQLTPAMDVCDMHIDRPFILNQKNDVLFRISANAKKQGAHVQLYTVDRRDQSKRTDHAYCEVRFNEFEKWSTKWKRKSYLIEERLAALDSAAATGKAHRIQRGLVYKLFSNFVDYDDDYQGIEEIILDSQRFEASARVVLKPTERGSIYEVPPTWIDSFCHLSGAILNASEAVDSKKFVFISHGWKSLRLLGGLKTGTSYRTYVRMQETGENIMEGDVWIFNDAKIIGVAKGIKFQRIPRKVINVLLPKPGSSPGNLTTEAEPQSASPQIHIDQLARPQILQSFTSTTSLAAVSRSEPSSVDSVLEVISSECGVDIAELVDGCSLASLGIDSLLSLEILAKLRESLGVDLRPHVFLENETIGDLKAQLLEMFVGATRREAQDVSVLSAFASTSRAISTPATFSDVSLEDETFESGLGLPRPHSTSPPSSVSSGISTPAKGQFSSPKAVSYLLSGNPRTATKYLFLFPDGSGSATSYATLPPLGSDVAVFALNCPFMTTPSLWQSGIGTVMKYYLDEIRRRQPKGPYNLGGWSAGGILAFEAARQVQKAGLKVDRLILIDSPCPVRLAPMPIKMFTFLDSIGLLGSGNVAGTPDWVIPHFEATVRNLDMYLPLPISPGKEPATTAIWARHGVTSASGGRRPAREPGDPKIMEWLLEDRTDFNYNGWDSLIGASAIRCEVIDGHHFSMTNEHVSVI
jgi:naphtho-gamma-pyrone polyketide synthase